MVLAAAPRHSQPYEPVRGPPPKWDKEALINHVKTGMQVELSTLPIYFCALYSIKRDNGGCGTKARASILSVAEQEMLHLALAGNMLRSLIPDESLDPDEKDKSRLLYDSSFIPKYPTEILFDKIPMRLQPANKENLECFLKIEAPFMPEPPPIERDLLPCYESVGKFYRSLSLGIEEVCEDGSNPFSSNPNMQFEGKEFFDSAMTVVTDKAAALQALETIVTQGEGGIGVPNSHYSVFIELYQRRKEWECVEYVDEPKTDNYKDNKVAYSLSLAVNAAYCYLLQTLDLCWHNGDRMRRRQILGNIHRIMIDILSPAAHVLVEQQVGTEGKYAAPCFEFYPAGKDSLFPADLFAALKRELESAKAAAQSQETVAAIGKILVSCDGIILVD